MSERDEVVRDHKNVEQAFTFTSYTTGEKKYEDTTREAEDQLSMAGETLADMRRVKEKDIARLTAGLRKAEMQVSSLEEQIDQKVR